jgi:Flp pilus assembly CpaE family ATPase
MNLSAQSTPGSMKSIFKGVLKGLTLLDTFPAFPRKDFALDSPFHDINPNKTQHHMGSLTPHEMQRLCKLQDLDVLNEALNPDPGDNVWKLSPSHGTNSAP